jgi:transposase InsO family protein
MDTESQLIYDRMTLHRLMLSHPDWTEDQFAAEISRSKKWVRTWTKRIENAEERSFKIYQSRSRQTPPKVKRVIADLRVELSRKYHRKAGADLILHELRKRKDLKEAGYFVPNSATTVNNILHELGYITTPKPRFHEPVVLPAPMEEWEMDFAQIYLSDGIWFEIFIVVDRGTSRVVHLEGSEGYHAETALQAVARCFIQHGMPKRLRMDRDSRFVGAWTSDSYPSALIRFLRALGVQEIICPPRRPDLKPFVERCIFTLKHEWIARHAPQTLAEAHDVLDSFKPYYHEERVHFGRACNGQTPSEAFSSLPSLPYPPERVKPNIWLEAEHGRVFRQRINSNGMIQVDKHRYYVDAKRKKQRVLVHLDAEHRRFVVTHGDDIIKRLPIADLHPDTMSFSDYLRIMKTEARSIDRHRQLMWRQTGEIA